MDAENLQCKCPSSRAGPVDTSLRAGNQPWVYLQPSPVLDPLGCSHHTPPAPGVGDGDLDSGLCTTELTEEIHWFREKQNSPGISLEERRNSVKMVLLLTVLFPLVA